MAIKADDKNIGGVSAAILKLAQRAEYLTVRTLSYLGEQCVRKVRDRKGEDSWYDQTGNLRSSVGYVIAHNGKILQYSEFNQVKDGAEGVLQGKQLAEQLVKTYSSGYALIIVAGMNYAEYVEAHDDKDVLASTELWARQQTPKMMDKLRKQIANVKL